MTGGSENIVQENILNVMGNIVNSNLNFRRTNAGLYFLVDTMGINSLVNNIPDSLKNLFEFQIDSEINVFSTPLYVGKDWPGFKAIVILSSLGLPFTLLEIKAYYEGEEDILVEALNEMKMSQKIRYEFILKIPDLSSPDITSVLNSPASIYNAIGWFVKDIGMVKLEGNTILINSLSGGSINLSDTTGIAREVLTNFNLQ